MNLKPTPLLCMNIEWGMRKKMGGKERTSDHLGRIHGGSKDKCDFDGGDSYILHTMNNNKKENTLDFHDINHMDRFSAYDEVLSI